MAIGKKTKKVVDAEGVAHVNATFNNTLITITDAHGNAVSWGSAGKAGFKVRPRPSRPNSARAKRCRSVCAACT
jgi:small subunit ribosomal protein S11